MNYTGSIERLLSFIVLLMFYVTESEKDTKASDVTEITFEPALKTFEIDIMERMGIQEDRVPAKTYWY
jgi:large subunit ribosomal protein L24